MNILVVTDKMNYLASQEKNIAKYVDCSHDEVYYFCSSIEDNYDIRGKEKRLIKIGDHSEEYGGHYDRFLKQTEALYHKLCKKFNPVYSKALKGFKLDDISEFDMCVLLMEFLRIYNLLKHTVNFNKIEKIVVLSPNKYKTDFRNGVCDCLEAFPVDSSMGALLAGEFKIEFINLKIDTARPVTSSFIVNLKKRLKHILRYVFHRFFRVKDMFTLKQGRRLPAIICFGSLGHLLPIVKEISKLQNTRLYFYHPYPLIKESAVLQMNNMKQISGQFDSLAVRFKFMLNKIVAAKISKKFMQTFRKDADNGVENFFTLLLNEYFEYSIPDFIHKFDLYTNLLYKIRPKAALLDENTSPLRKPFEIAAQRMGVPAFVANHGMPQKSFPVFLWKNVTNYSYIFIGGEYLIDFYRTCHNANTDRLIVTGTPRYDDIDRLKKDKSLAMPTICFAPNFFMKRGTAYNFTDYIISFKKNVDVIAEKYKEKPFNLIVKFHPGDTHENVVRSAFAKSGVRATYITDQSRSIDVLKNSNLLITCWSTMALEGYLCGIPVIIMNNFSGLPEPIDFIKDRIAVFATTPYMLGSLIDNYRTGIFKNTVYDPLANSASFKYEKFQDGLASKRAACFILEKSGINNSW